MERLALEQLSALQLASTSAADQENYKLAETLFNILCGEFFFDVHTSTELSSEYQTTQKNDGAILSQMLVTVKVDTCAKPPSKKKLLSVLYQLLFDYDEEANKGMDIGGIDPLDLVHNYKRIPHEWIWQLIENVSKSCKHDAT